MLLVFEKTLKPHISKKLAVYIEKFAFSTTKGSNLEPLFLTPKLAYVANFNLFMILCLKYFTNQCDTDSTLLLKQHSFNNKNRLFLLNARVFWSVVK